MVVMKHHEFFKVALLTNKVHLQRNPKVMEEIGTEVFCSDLSRE
jgi:hypothetical protein